MSARKQKPGGFGVFRTPSEQEKSQYIGSLVAQWEKQVTVAGKTEGPTRL